MKLFSLTAIIFGLIAFAIANEQMNNCTDDGCSDFYDGNTDSTPAPIVKITPINYTPVVNTTNGKDEFVMSLSQCIDHIYQDVPVEKQIPKTLIIAQAALETGWGVSRFANEGNNLFGIRTWNIDEPHLLPIPWTKWPGWGVKVYETRCDSVRDYLRILNEVFAFSEFRAARDSGIDDGIILADYLSLYASNQNYTKLIKEVIKYNIRGEYDI